MDVMNMVNDVLITNTFEFFDGGVCLIRNPFATINCSLSKGEICSFCFPFVIRANDQTNPSDGH